MIINFTKKEVEDLVDALQEWFDVIQPKYLQDNETGLNIDRYERLINKLLNKIHKGNK
jgi:hypothetical protein